MDALSPVSKDYADRRPFAFTGRIETVRFDFGESIELTSAEELDMKLKMD
jgi:hypothetical protein